ncbi:MAG: phosphate ABC transporter, permease protein PstA, partial [Lachnospiraceae bacterium]|nr:phosphate ABC transporter, permease protein PstA [Lachnospiraceae bacterium]
MDYLKHHPLSALVKCLVWLAAIITAVVLVFIIGFIMIKGIPNLKPSLFAWKYTSDNVSLMPALINTLIVTALA